MRSNGSFFYEQIKVLREVDDTPRPAGYWCDFVDRLIPQLGSLASEFGLPRAGKDPETTRATVVAFIAAAYPGAKRYLIQRCEMPREQVEAFPITQTVALAVVRYYEQARDEYFKWTYLPFWQQNASGNPTKYRRSSEIRCGFGWLVLRRQPTYSCQRCRRPNRPKPVLNR